MKYSEVRQNPATKQWVVIAPERPVVEIVQVETQPPFDRLCPFCPGNEHMSPTELLRVSSNSHNSDWQVRVIRDKFAALSPDIPPVKGDGFFRKLSGFGHHEIVIESPLHNEDLGDMSIDQVVKVLNVYRMRQRDLQGEKNVRFVVIFRNHGALSGAFCSHPHGQIMATQFVPEFMQRKQEIAKCHSGMAQRNLYSEIWEAETSSERLIETNESVASFVPFAATVPYEMWIMAREPHPSFARASDRDLEGLAGILHRSLARLRNCCGDVAYGLVIYSAAVHEEGPYYQWHVQITPRLVRPSGAELGPHIRVNPTLPEDCARELRASPAELAKSTVPATAHT